MICDGALLSLAHAHYLKMTAANYGGILLSLLLVMRGVHSISDSSRLSSIERKYHRKDVDKTPVPPVWPNSYKVFFTIMMPQLYLMQPQGLSIPVQAWFDGLNKRSRVDLFDGLDKIIENEAGVYNVHPRIDKLNCWVDLKTGVRAEIGDADLMLPDLTKWQYAGSVTIDGKPANIWRLQFRQGDQVSSYTFYTSSLDGSPMKYHMFGMNSINHYDEYIYEFHDYEAYPRGAPDSLFIIPDLCKDQGMIMPEGAKSTMAKQLAMLMPGSRTPPGTELALEMAYTEWAVQHGRSPARNAGELQQRIQRFKQNSLKVQAHNAKTTKSYTMQLSRFADWTEEEYYSILFPEKWQRMRGKPSILTADMPSTSSVNRDDSYRPLGKFKRHLSKNDLPKEVDWRGTGADPGIKDQGMCGSCWAFGATGAMEGSWYVQTGERRSFSEQHLMDCMYSAWGVNACYGGDAKPGINFAAKQGGTTLEQDYYYTGTDNYCLSSNFTHVGQFEGFLQIEPRDELAMMEAVYTLGPLSVAVDPYVDSFSFYKEGVYFEEECNNHDLGHQVLLYGYGTSDQGVDYWLVKNSWSKLWGNDGYIKIARGEKDCGIASDGIIAVVRKDKVNPGAGGRALEGVKRW